MQQIADKIVASSVETTKVQLVEAISRTAETAAHNTPRKRMLQWAAGCLGVASLALVGVLYLGIEIGYEKGTAVALQHATYKNEARSWLDATEGQMAVALTRMGEMPSVFIGIQARVVFQEILSPNRFPTKKFLPTSSASKRLSPNSLKSHQTKLFSKIVRGGATF